MHPLLDFYRRTWWLWLAFVSLFITLGIYVSFVFWILIPGLLIYSIYFGMVRASEETPAAASRGFDVRPAAGAARASEGVAAEPTSRPPPPTQP
jgi:hypothetical protein